MPISYGKLLEIVKEEALISINNCGVEKWSSRPAHNWEIGGSNPPSATNFWVSISDSR